MPASDGVVVFDISSGTEDVIGNVYIGLEILTRMTCDRCKRYSYLRVTIISPTMFTVARTVGRLASPASQGLLSKREFSHWCNDSSQARFIVFFFVCSACEAPHCIQLLPYTEAGFKMMATFSPESWIPTSLTMTVVTWRVPDEICWLLGKWSAAYAPQIDLRDDLEISPLLLDNITGKEILQSWKYRAYMWALQRYNSAQGLYATETKCMWAKWVDATFDDIDIRARTFWDIHMRTSKALPLTAENVTSFITPEPESPSPAAKQLTKRKANRTFRGVEKPYRQLIPKSVQTSVQDHELPPLSALGKRYRQSNDEDDGCRVKKKRFIDPRNCVPGWRLDTPTVDPTKVMGQSLDMNECSGPEEAGELEQESPSDRESQPDYCSDSGSNEGLSYGSSETLSDDDSDSFGSLVDFIADSDEEA